MELRKCLAEAGVAVAGDPRVTIGPCGSRNGFLLRLLSAHERHAGRFARDEKKMERQIIARDKTLHQGSLGREKTKRCFRDKGRGLQGEAGRHHSGNARSRSIFQGDGSTSAASRI